MQTLNNLEDQAIQDNLEILVTQKAKYNTMRQQTKQMNDLLAEFKAIRSKLFPDGVQFVVYDGSAPDQKRYDQLFAFFYPSFRTENWINPLNS